MKWHRRRDSSTSPAPARPKARPGSGPVLIVALDGFLAAGSAPRLAVEHLTSGHGEVLHSFDIDATYDYRARRPPLRFVQDHYLDYEEPRLQVVQEHDLTGRPFLVLSGPEPDFGWEGFAREVRDVIESLGVPLTLSLGAVPMGVPHTRPLLVTAHGTRPDLVDRTNLWSAEVTVPSSAQSLLEYRLGSWGHDAAGYVVHVPHYLAQVDFPGGAIALLDAAIGRLGLQIDLEPLRARQQVAVAEIESQITEQQGTEVLQGLEQQYDAFSRGAAQSLLASDDELPSGDELANQFEDFLAKQRKDDDG